MQQWASQGAGEDEVSAVGRRQRVAELVAAWPAEARAAQPGPPAEARSALLVGKPPLPAQRRKERRQVKGALASATSLPLQTQVGAGTAGPLQTAALPSEAPCADGPVCERRFLSSVRDLPGPF